jgi:hypothetical protein
VRISNAVVTVAFLVSGMWAGLMRGAIERGYMAGLRNHRAAIAMFKGLKLDLRTEERETQNCKEYI